MRQDDAFEAGFDAYWEGLSPENNPFERGGLEEAAWLKGWRQAELKDGRSIDDCGSNRGSAFVTVSATVHRVSKGTES